MASPQLLEEGTTHVPQELPAGGFVGRFGLDPWLLAAQAVNFAIVLFVLTRFVFWPLLRLLRARQAKIAQGVRDAAEASRAKGLAEDERRVLLAKAAEEAYGLRQRAAADGHRIRDDVVRAAEQEASAIRDRAEREAAERTQGAVRAATREVGDLVVDACERLLAEKLSAGDRAKYREAALRSLKRVAGQAS